MDLIKPTSTPLSTALHVALQAESSPALSVPGGAALGCALGCQTRSGQRCRPAASKLLRGFLPQGIVVPFVVMRQVKRAPAVLLPTGLRGNRRDILQSDARISRH